MDTMIKNMKLTELSDCFLEYANFKNDLVECNCLSLMKS